MLVYSVLQADDQRGCQIWQKGVECFAEIMLPEEVRRLIQSTIPTIDALEVLMFLTRQSGVAWRPNEVVNQMQPTVIGEAAVRDYLVLFQVEGLMVSQADGSLLYRPATAQIEAAVQALIQAYNERPVTLIRAVYEIANSKKIQAFADAFKIKKE